MPVIWDEWRKSMAVTGGEQQKSVVFLRKEFFSYIFYDSATNLTTKTIFLEPVSTNCPSCEVQLDPNLMMRLCYNSSCTP